MTLHSMGRPALPIVMIGLALAILLTWPAWFAVCALMWCVWRGSRRLGWALLVVGVLVGAVVASDHPQAHRNRAQISTEARR